MRKESADAEEARAIGFAPELSKVLRTGVKAVRGLTAAASAGLEADISGRMRNSGPAWLPKRDKSGHWEERTTLHLGETRDFLSLAK